MIVTHALAHVLIVAAPAAAIALVVGLQRLLKLPRTSRVASSATGLVGVTSHVAVPRLTWDTVSARWNPFVTWVLPILTSLAIVGLGLWPFTYLGWLVIETNLDPGWAQQVPPWFGNPGYFLGLGVAGLVIAVTGAIVLGGIGFALHALGKCLLWPEVCAVCNPPQGTADGDGTSGSEAYDHDN